MNAIKGCVNEYGQPLIEINVMGIRKGITCPAVINSGFNGDVCVPTPIAIQLGLELVAAYPIELADGTVRNELVFAGEVVFNGRRESAEILLTEAQDTLLGTGLLLDSVLEINFPKRAVEIK